MQETLLFYSLRVLGFNLEKNIGKIYAHTVQKHMNLQRNFEVRNT